VGNWGGGILLDHPIRSINKPEPHRSLEQKHTDPDWIARNENYKQACRHTSIDMLPISMPDIGTVSLAPMLGAVPKFADNNIWYKHDPHFGPETDRTLLFDKEAEWWKIISQSTEAVKKISSNNYFTGCPAICPNLDVLAELRELKT
jgi:hypothetical protein